MGNLNITVNARRPLVLSRSSVVGTEALRYLINALTEVGSGLLQSDGIVWRNDEDNPLTAPCTQSLAMLVLSSAAGAVGGTLAGQLVTVTASGGDTATATALAAAIRATTTSDVNRVVTATNESAAVTLASVTAGQYIDICGTRFTAVSGTPPNSSTFDISGSDTADALSLAAAINSNPSTCLRYRAVSSGAVVRVFRSTQREAMPGESILNAGNFATFTVGVPTFTAGAFVAVIASVPGRIGNEVRAAASGTGVTIVTAGGAGLLGSGLGGGTVPYFLLP